jgi:hypothetical protein
VKQRRMFATLIVASALIVTSALAAPAIAKTINGDNRANVLVGTNRADLIHGREGGDTLRGKGGPDRLYGEGGFDTIEGGRGEDRISGGNGRDTLRGGKGDDRISSAGLYPDVVDCGRGRQDLARVDPEDEVKNCERVRTVEPTAVP